MRKLRHRLTLIGFLILGGCNSTDALTPPMDVGGTAAQSPPVTQRDLDQMSADSRPVGNAQVSAMGAPRQSGSTDSLESQAAALSSGSTNPVSSGEGGLVVDDPSPAAAPAAGTTPRQPAAQPQQSAPPRQPPAPPQTQSAAVAPATSESIRFLPIIGAPVEAVTPLSRQLGTQARARGLTIKSSSDNTSRHILKGYFSAMADNGKTTVTYVWDVLDSSGARLHRIQGQDSVEATANDPWAAVPAGTMEAIASRTIQEYMSWKQQTGG